MSSMPSDQTLSGSQSGQLSPLLIRPRKSCESVRVMPTQPKQSTANDRSFSFSSGPSSRPRQPTTTLTSRPPIVYPALLSRVAEAFRSRIMLAERTKDGLTYTECFDGREAVDKIAYIIKTTDRNLALLLGRALDSQKFFHDVTYDHRLRDSHHELYQFRGTLTNTFTAEQDNPRNSTHDSLQQTSRPISEAQSELDGLDEEEAQEDEVTEEEEDVLPCGVFTLLTDCYSPTCTRDRLCYSIACPRRLEQQARLNLKPKPGLQRSLSTESLGDLKEPGTLWIHSVPQEVVDSVNDTEKKRQEAINECIYTERDFVRDLEYLRDVWIKPLQASNIIPEARRQDFLSQVFWNVLEVLSVNSRLCELLSKRQKSAHVVPHIADIYLELVPHFSPFVKYGAHQLYGKYEFEREKSANPAFAKFVDEAERLPESRKLELNAYLTKPTTRLARYPLLLEVVLKYTPDDHIDKTEIPKVVKMIRELLAKVNIETGKSENRFNLAQLDQQLVFRQGEAVDLRLREEGRELIYKGQLKKRGGSGSDSAELQVYLFDHALLMVKHKHSNKTDQLKVYRKPIPLELLTVTGVTNQEDGSTGGRGLNSNKKSLMTRNSGSDKGKGVGTSVSSNGVVVPIQAQNKAGFSMTINQLGRRGYSIVLWAPTPQSRQKWLDKIYARQAQIREQNTIFEMVSLNEGFFVGPYKVNCAVPFDNGNRLIFGNDVGVYLAVTSDPTRAPVQVIQVENVTQVDIIEEQGILLVLADKVVMTFWMDGLDPNDAAGAAKRARKVSSNASFFKVGDCLGRKLVCVVKAGSVSSTIKTLEPTDNLNHQLNVRTRTKPAFRKIIPANNDALKVYKEFYIPTVSSSVHFLKSKLCIGCQKGFEIVNLETLDVLGLLDPADHSLDFVARREAVKPISIFRIEAEFLLCYEEFAFYVSKTGWRCRLDWIIQWEGNPTAFALHYPFVLAFDPSFVEVRHVDTGLLVQVIPGPNLRHLFSESPPSISAPLLAAAAARQQELQQQSKRSQQQGLIGYPSQSQVALNNPSINSLALNCRPQIIFSADSKVIQLRLKQRQLSVAALNLNAGQVHHPLIPSNNLTPPLVLQSTTNSSSPAPSSFSNPHPNPTPHPHSNNLNLNQNPSHPPHPHHLHHHHPAPNLSNNLSPYPPINPPPQLAPAPLAPPQILLPSQPPPPPQPLPNNNLNSNRHLFHHLYHH
ncbi:hypothetical protein, variant [Puccinia graminis f. sp. tritici CRL 75-36-700-3]|uniref:RHO1 GDP-GTP exchange protein 2 n=2 Tax=Puccinia graminis f. sp. tritici (strain CRL 75-36-700-3 / race SCCL) TaxID=418459 RepID=H6QT78_PUCGT|nr:hypothetical protein, variant [Puccinia graminis f. sp. tritici CRL 75-36-700-3]EHS64032.1 hypothetical protein, variant [Puccinia graminis f. sp. tritici CRL 75-36-700-3]